MLLLDKGSPLSENVRYERAQGTAERGSLLAKTDGGALLWGPGSYDRILIDAPPSQIDASDPGDDRLSYLIAPRHGSRFLGTSFGLLDSSSIRGTRIRRTCQQGLYDRVLARDGTWRRSPRAIRRITFDLLAFYDGYRQAIYAILVKGKKNLF